MTVLFLGPEESPTLAFLRESETNSKVIILLTDGVNNAGKIDPQTAAEMAKALDVKIYTIGVGTKGPVPYPVKDLRGRVVYRQVTIPIDDESLERIALTTGGEYFRATDTGSLEKIFEIKILREELFPAENLLSDPELINNGKFTEKGLATLREKMPHTELGEFENDPDINKLGDLFTVNAIVNYVDNKLNAA